MSATTINLDLYKDIVFFAGFGMQSEYFQTLYKFPENIRQEILDRTFQILTIENKNESLEIAYEIFDQIKNNEKLLLEGLSNCYHTNILSDEIIKSDLKSSFKLRAVRTKHNAEELFQLIAVHLNPKSLQKIHSDIKNYITKVLPEIDILNSEEKLDSKLHTDISDVNTIYEEFKNFIDEKMMIYNQINKHNNVIYFSPKKITNKEVLVFDFITNSKSRTYNLILTKNNNFLISVSGPDSKFRQIGIAHIKQIHKIIIKDIITK